MKFGELSKHTASKYAALTPEEKDVWLQKAAADKARFIHELKNYQAPAGYDEKGDAIPNHPRHAPPTTPTRGRKPGKRKAPVPRDPNAPKRNASAFLLYQNCYRKVCFFTSLSYDFVCPIKLSVIWILHMNSVCLLFDFFVTHMY